MIYFPMTANILTVGHIKALELLVKEDFVRVGLLTKEALEGYKPELVSYEERKFILESIIKGFEDWEDIKVVPQDSLDPSANIRKYRITSFASGDGFEPIELEAIKTYNLKKITFDSGSLTHSSDIIKKANEHLNP